MKRLAHHRPVSDKCTLLGHKDHHEEIEITIVLRRKLDHDPLPTTEDYANGYVPISREEFIVKYGSSPDDALAVANHYRSIGFTHIDTHHGRRHVYLRGTVRQINLAFNTTMGNFEKHHCNQMMYFHAPTTPLHVPDHLHDLIMGTHGFDLEPLAIPHSVPANTVELTPAQVMAVYNWPTNLATGQTIAVMMQNAFGPINQSDINATCARYGVPSVSVPVISVDGSTLGDGTEAITDIGVLATYAQGANLVAYIGAEINSAISRVAFPQAGEATCHIATFSGGFIEDVVGLDTLHIFEDCAVLGITLICSVGDWGSTLDFTDVGTNQVQAEFPGTHPFWTAVGGTTLGNISTPISANSSFQEWYWDETSISQTVGHGNMGGGGVSRVYAKPGFQKNITVPQTLSTIAPLYNGQGRGFPDIAANSAFKSGLEIFANGGTLLDFYGTSVAAPIMAALFARINAALGHPVGYLNPTLYKIGTGTNIIRDINANDAGSPSTNANFAGHGAPGYPVNVGWDACTGLGRIDGKNLLAYYQARDTTLGSVTNISVISTNLPAGTITVGWTPPVSNLGITYDVLLSTDGAAFAFLGYTTDTTFVGTGLSPGHTYSFGVIPISENLQGAGVGSPLFQLVAPVTAIHVVSFDSTSITIGWTAPSVGTGFNYKVLMQTGGGAFNQVGNPTTTTFAATGLTPSTSYVFQVIADIGGSDSTVVTGGPFATAAAVIPVNESPDGMFIADAIDLPTNKGAAFFAAHQSLLVGPIVGVDGTKWTLQVSNTPYQVAHNGVLDPLTQETILLVYSGHRIYKENKDSTWQSKAIPSDTWVTANDPRFGAIVPNQTPLSSDATDTLANGSQYVASQHNMQVLDGLVVETLYWGDEWNNIANTFTSTSQIDSAITSLLTLPVWSGLQEYGIYNPPVSSFSNTISGSLATLPVDPVQVITQFLNNLIAGFGIGTIQPKDGLIFCIIYPPSIAAPNGIPSNSDSFFFRGVRVNYATVYTSAIPSLASATTSGRATTVATHVGMQMINTATDPNWPIDWPLGVITPTQTIPGPGTIKGTWFGLDLEGTTNNIVTQAVGRIEDYTDLLTFHQPIYFYYSNKIRNIVFAETATSLPANIPALPTFTKYESFASFFLQTVTAASATFKATPPVSALPTDSIVVKLDYKRACDVTWTNFNSQTITASALATTPLQITALTNNTLYMFRASANGGRYCPPVMGITSATNAPGPVTNVVVTTTNTTQILTWNPPANAGNGVTYRVLSSTTSGLSGFALLTSGLAATTFTATGETPNTQYWYEIIPTIGGVDGPTTTAGPFFTTQTGTAPGPVTNIVSAGNTSSSISISWTAPVGVPTTGLSYSVAASITSSSGPFNIAGTASTTATNFTLNGTTPDTDYYFSVIPSLNGVTGNAAIGGPFRFTTVVLNFGTTFNQTFSINSSLAFAPTTMSAIDKSSGITVSNGGLTVASTLNTLQGIRSTRTVDKTVVYYEATINVATDTLAVGFCNDNYLFTFGHGLGTDTLTYPGIGWTSAGYAPSCNYLPGQVLCNNQRISGYQVTSWGTTKGKAGDVIGIYVDFTNLQAWFTSTAMQADGNAWNNLPASQAVPGTSGGLPLDFLPPGPFFAAMSSLNSGASVTFNFGATPFHFLKPVGALAYQDAASGYVLPAGPLPAPKGLIGSTPPTASSIAMQWTAVPGATSYTLEMYGETFTNNQWVVVHVGPETIFTATVTPNGLNVFPYFFRVAASNGTALGPWSYPTAQVQNTDNPLKPANFLLTYLDGFFVDGNGKTDATMLIMPAPPNPSDFLPNGITAWLCIYAPLDPTNQFLFTTDNIAHPPLFNFNGWSEVNGPNTGFFTGRILYTDNSYEFIDIQPNVQYQVYFLDEFEGHYVGNKVGPFTLSQPGTAGYTGGGWNVQLFAPGTEYIAWGQDDYAVIPVATTTHVAVHYASDVYAPSQVATVITPFVNMIETLYAQAVTWFGTHPFLSPTQRTSINPDGRLINVFLVANRDFGGAHLACANADILVNSSNVADSINPRNMAFIFMAELVEVFMPQLSALPDCDQHAFGEALSVAMASELFPDVPANSASPTLAAFYMQNANSSGVVLRDDRINTNAAGETFAQFPDIGCNILFITYLVHQLNFTYTQICSALKTLPANATAATLYHTLTGDLSNPFPAFIAKLNAHFPIATGVPANFPANPWPLS